MFSWSFKRKLIYLTVPALIMLLLGFFVFIKYFSTKPSCSDGKQNGDETGLDCGGSCQLLCTSDTLSPVVRWSESFLVSGSVWNAGAYVENPNISSEAPKASYVFRLYDEKNLLITEVTGETFVPKNKKFLVFYPSIETGGRVVKRTEFEFTGEIMWFTKDAHEPDLKVIHNPIEKSTTAPLISGVVENVGVVQSPPVELSVIIYDGRGNAIGISRTYVDSIDVRGKTIFGFTWPKPFKETQISCEVPSDVILLLDRSGSMTSISRTPPEPLDTVKDNAITFVSSRKTDDQVGVVSFANEASDPIDHVLSSNINDVIDSIKKIFIATTTAQNTNIGDGFVSATKELMSYRANPEAKKVIVLLTDGDPTDPKLVGQSNYPTLFAEQSASYAKDKNISIFTVGLGSLVNKELLSRLASTPAQFFSAPTSSDLEMIYSQINKSICTIKPNVIEIIAIPQAR
ncbi:MAG: vWA domain-containing protein [Minisyncoccota bacterium]